MNYFIYRNLMKIAQFAYMIPCVLRKLYKRPRTFSFCGNEFVYFEHPYNGSWMNERAIEIPIIWDWVKKYSPDKVLEIGNVLSHYFQVRHTVIDKYEQEKNVIIADVADVKLNRRFNCIVSISTLEHVGWDELPKVAGKHVQALDNLINLLEPSGKIIITIPLGFNPPFDEDIFSGRLGCNTIYYFKRISTEEWQAASKDEVLHSQYGITYRSTDGLAICEWSARQA